MARGIGTGLTKHDRSSDPKVDLDAFINSAKVGSKKASSGAGAVFRRTTFSLTDAVNDEIDRLCLVPRKNATRSEIVRAGIAALAAMPEEEIVRLIESVRSE